jgi:hypothetical protein
MEWATRHAGAALEYDSAFRTESTHQSMDKLLIMCEVLPVLVPIGA